MIAQTEEPLLVPAGDARDGYVPRVVYSCGPIAHAGTLWIPVGVGDSRIRVYSTDIDRSHLEHEPPLGRLKLRLRVQASPRRGGRRREQPRQAPTRPAAVGTGDAASPHGAHDRPHDDARDRDHDEPRQQESECDHDPVEGRDEPVPPGDETVGEPGRVCLDRLGDRLRASRSDSTSRPCPRATRAAPGTTRASPAAPRARTRRRSGRRRWSPAP